MAPESLPESLVGLILAGGQGKRLGGRDKALISLAGRPLLDHVLGRLGPQLNQIALSANGDPSRLAAYRLPILADHFADKGPLAGVHAGLIWAGLIWAGTTGAKALVTVSVDCPFLPPDLVSRLWSASLAGGICPAYARAGGRDHPTMALWPLGLLPALTDHLASNAPPRLADFLVSAGAVTADFGDSQGFANINTPEDLTRAEALCHGT